MYNIHFITFKTNFANKTILFFGDSLTAGYGLKDVSLESLPARIQEKINADKLPFKVINGELSGETSAGGLERIDLFVDQHFDLFILELGANDILSDIPAEITHNNQQSLIDKVKSNYPNITMLFLGMEIPAWLAEPRTIPFNFVFRKIANNNIIGIDPFLIRGGGWRLTFKFK